MAHMLLVNSLPRKRKPGKKRKSSSTKESKVMAKKRKAHRTAKQKAATEKMLAANKAAKSHKTTKRRKARASKKLAVVTVTSHRSNKQGHPLTARGRARARKPKVAGYSANPLRRRKSARRHNPISLKAIPQTLGKVAMPVLGGAALSIALDKVMGKIPVPAMLRVPGKEKMQMAYLSGVRIAAALGVMLVGRKMAPKHSAAIDGAGIGSMTVTVTDVARSLMPGHIAQTAAVHGYDQMAGYELNDGDSMGGYDMVQRRLAGDASGMGGFDNSMQGVGINSSVYN